MSRRTRGWTLIEALVALLLFAILATMAWSGLDRLTTTRATLAARQADWQDLNGLFGRIGQDLEQVCNRSIRDAQDQIEPPLVGQVDAGGSSDWLVAFTRLGDTRAPLQRLAYRLRAHSVELLVWPAVDPAPGAQPARYVLLDGVDRFEWHFLDLQGHWQATWPLAGGATPRPVAVRVTVTLTDGSRYERIFALS